MVNLIINGQEYQVEEGKRLLVILREKGFRIPSICFHSALLPAAACKLCVVEIKEGKRPPRTRLSCAVKVQQNMEVTTESAMVHKLRNEAIGNLLKLAPNSEIIHKIGLEFGLSTGMKPDGCIRCRLCVRACSDIIGANALTMVKRENIQYVVPSETGTCIGCGTCSNICPTGAIRCEDHENVRTILIRDEVIGRNALVRCDICGSYYATTLFLDYVRQREGAHPYEKEPHHHCPTCAKIYAKRNVRITTPRLARTYSGTPAG
jgi:bidirectional [NiFe] hydrogenase diaphorase subunit